MPVFRGSRYTNTPVYVSRGQTNLLETRPRYAFNMSKATYYTVVAGDTMDGIAFKQYGNAQLYWAILDANKQYLTEVDMKAGDIIAIPSYDEVVSKLG